MEQQNLSEVAKPLLMQIQTDLQVMQTWISTHLNFVKSLNKA